MGVSSDEPETENRPIEPELDDTSGGKTEIKAVFPKG